MWSDRSRSSDRASRAFRPSVRRALLGGALLSLAAAAALSAGDGKAIRRSVYASDFAAGEGRAIAERACLVCHSASLVTQQAKDSTGWEKTLGQMEKWGVKLSPAEHDALRGYLLAHYGPRVK